MSNGKGDKDRTKDRKAYAANYALIDFSKKSDGPTVAIRHTLKWMPREEGGLERKLEVEQWENEGGKND